MRRRYPLLHHFLLHVEWQPLLTIFVLRVQPDYAQVCQSLILSAAVESDDRVVCLTDKYKSIINVVNGVQVQFTSRICLTFGQRNRILLVEAKVYVAHILEIDVVDYGNHVNRFVIEVYLVLAHAHASHIAQFELFTPRLAHVRELDADQLARTVKKTSDCVQFHIRVILHLEQRQVRLILAAAGSAHLVAVEEALLGQLSVSECYYDTQRSEV